MFILHDQRCCDRCEFGADYKCPDSTQLNLMNVYKHLVLIVAVLSTFCMQDILFLPRDSRCTIGLVHTIVIMSVCLLRSWSMII